MLISQHLIERCYSYLDCQERLRSEAFRFASDRSKYIMAHGLLRSLLARYLRRTPNEVEFSHNNFGRPQLRMRLGDLPVRFSITHTMDLISCALTVGRDVGVDAEKIAPLDELSSFSKLVLSPEELAVFFATSLDERQSLVYRLWTLKEAYLKALGIGLSMDPSCISFLINPDHGITIMNAVGSTKSPNTWKFHSWQPTCQHWLSVAIESTGALGDNLVVKLATVDDF